METFSQEGRRDEGDGLPEGVSKVTLKSAKGQKKEKKEKPPPPQVQIFVCFDGFYGTPRQYRSLGTDYTFESVKMKVERWSYETHLGIAVNYWSRFLTCDCRPCLVNRRRVWQAGGRSSPNSNHENRIMFSSISQDNIKQTILSSNIKGTFGNDFSARISDFGLVVLFSCVLRHAVVALP